MEIALDPGTPIPAFPAGSKRGLALHTNVCPSPRCPDLHLRAAEIHDAGDERAKVAHEGALHFDLDFSTGQLAGRDDPASAWLASEQGAWLAPWVAENAALLRGRFDRLKGQAANEPADARPAPAWKPGGVVFHHQLYPHDFAPMFRHAGKPWLILDGCCPDPACTCTDTTLGFLRPEGGMIDVVGELGVRRPTKGDAQGKALWKAVHDEPELLDLLRDRRDEIRHAGPFIVGAAYEEARLARQASAAAAITAAQADDGYLQGGAIPEALVRRLFDAAGRLYGARNAIEDAWPAVFRVEIRGAIDRDAWSDISSEPTTVALFAAPGDLEPWLDVALVQRDEVTLEMRRQRCALGLPLLGGTSLPLVDRWAPEMKLLPPSADDVRTMVAVLEALLAAPCEDVLDVADSGAPGVFEHHVDLDTGAVDVRLTASHAEHPWSAELLEESDDLDEGDLDDEDEDEGDLDDDDLDDEDEDDDELGARTLLEAFTDAAVDRGLARDVVRTARAIGAALARYAAAEGRSLFDDRTWAAFLTEHAPREVMLDEGDIARAPAALRAFVDWLGEIGHVEPRRFRASLDRALPVFQQRARDPHRFGMAKAVFTEMRDAGVDLEDQAAIDRFLAAKNAAVDQMLRPSALIAPPAPSPAPATVTRSPTRWSPAPGERWPAPTDPCGCGSGRRFKKCCMAR